MNATVYTVANVGNDYHVFAISCEVTNGIGIHLVGMHDIAVKESLLRTVTALQACGYKIPGKKINIFIETVAPRQMFEMRTTCFDVPIAMAILLASEQVKASEDVPLKQYLLLGELGLDGSVRTPSDDMSGYFVYRYMNWDVSRFVMPFEIAVQTAPFVPRDVYSPQNLKDVISLMENPNSDESKQMVVWKTDRWKKLVYELAEPTK